MNVGTAESQPALRDARAHLAQYDSNRDYRDRDRHIRHLALAGTSVLDSAAALGISHTTVKWVREQEPAPDRPEVPDHRVTETRAQELEVAAKLALRLSLLLRDEDPNLVWGTLARLSRQQLQELTVAALAAIPVDGWTPGELFAWVTDLPAAQEMI